MRVIGSSSSAIMLFVEYVPPLPSSLSLSTISKLQLTTPKLVNQTLSQSVPSNVVIAVRSVTKVFAGEIIELARRIQTEELHASVDDPAPNHDLQPRHQNTIPIPTTFIPRGPLDPPPSYPNSQYNSAPGTSANTPAGGGGGGGGEEMDGEGFTKEGKKREYNDADWEQLNENRMQPLRPPVSADHLREAVRRYRVEREGGLVGFMGLERTQHSTGAERFGNKFGGRRMMR